MISSNVQLLQSMRSLVGWNQTASYLGPSGNLTLNLLTPFNDPSDYVLKLLAPSAHVKLAQLNSSHCLHDAARCTAYGLTVSVWLRLTPTGDSSSAAVSLISSQSMSCTYSMSGGLTVSVQFPSGRPFWNVLGVQLPLSRFVNLVISWSMSNGLAVYVNNTLMGSMQNGNTYRAPIVPNATSELILGDLRATARPMVIELYNFAYWDSAVSSSTASSAMGLDTEKAALIGGASDFWTFYGIYSALQPQVPAAYGKGLSKTTDRTGRGFGAVTDAPTNSYIVLATAAQVLSGGALGSGARGLLQPDMCAGGLSFSFYLKFGSGLQGYLFSSGGELPGSTGFAISIANTQLMVTASSNSTLLKAIYLLDTSYFGTWLKLQVYWQPPGSLTGMKLGAKTPYSQVCLLI